jgi:putative sigma-54 modulation protein
MKIDIHPSNLGLKSEYRQHIEQRVQMSLSRIGQHIQHLEIRLADTNGPRGGIDKRCRVLVHFDAGEPMLIEKHGAHILELIDLTIDRVGRLAVKRLQSKRTFSPAPLFDAS